MLQGRDYSTTTNFFFTIIVAGDYWGTYKTRNEKMGNKKWGNEEMRKWNGNGRQARWDEVAL